MEWWMCKNTRVYCELKIGKIKDWGRLRREWKTYRISRCEIKEKIQGQEGKIKGVSLGMGEGVGERTNEGMDKNEKREKSRSWDWKIK